LNKDHEEAIQIWNIVLSLIVLGITSWWHTIKSPDLEKQGIINYNVGKSRPDFAGLDENKEWHVVEAKGYSNQININNVNIAKQQAQMVNAINNNPPKTKVASVTCFDKTSTQVLFEDPPEKGQIDLEIDTGGFLEKCYYYLGRMKSDYKDKFEKIKIKNFITVSEPISGIKFGYLSDLFEIDISDFNILTEKLDALWSFDK
jgi:hypothetical protein